MDSSIDPLGDPPGVLVTLRGTLDAPALVDVLAALAARLTSTGTPPGLRVLWDAREVTRILVVPEDLPTLSVAMDALREPLGEGRSALLYTPGQLDPELIGRLMAARAPRGLRERAVFHDAEAAHAWLRGTDPPP